MKFNEKNSKKQMLYSCRFYVMNMASCWLQCYKTIQLYYFFLLYQNKFPLYYAQIIQPVIKNIPMQIFFPTCL